LIGLSFVILNLVQKCNQWVDVDQMKSNVLDTSIDAYYSMPNQKKKGQADRIEAVVLYLCAGTVNADCSLREIKRVYDRNFAHEYGEIDAGTVSARVNELIAAGRLERLETIRKCSKSGAGIHPVRPAPKQHSLFGMAA
jgi:hypothetical protein